MTFLLVSYGNIFEFLLHYLIWKKKEFVFFYFTKNVCGLCWYPSLYVLGKQAWLLKRFYALPPQKKKKRCNGIIVRQEKSMNPFSKTVDEAWESTGIKTGHWLYMQTHVCALIHARTQKKEFNINVLSHKYMFVMKIHMLSKFRLRLICTVMVNWVMVNTVTL